MTFYVDVPAQYNVYHCILANIHIAARFRRCHDLHDYSTHAYSFLCSGSVRLCSN